MQSDQDFPCSLVCSDLPSLHKPEKSFSPGVALKNYLYAEILFHILTDNRNLPSPQPTKNRGLTFHGSPISWAIILKNYDAQW